MDRRTLLGALVVGGAGALSVGGFLFTENIIGPRRPTARAIIDRFEEINGISRGFRRNHAKGVAVHGYFESNGQGIELSTASVFRAGNYPLCGRFSLSGGKPYVTDTPGAVRGLGLRIDLPEGEQWRTAMIDLPVFLDPTPQDFYDRMLAFAPDPATGKPDPRMMSEYLAAHPRTVAAMATAEATPAAPTLTTTTFNGLNAFEMTNAHGVKVPVRWKLVPETRTAVPVGNHGSDYLFDRLAADIEQQARRWAMVIVVGIPGQDRTDDASVAWPADRETVTVGTVVLTGISRETADNVGNVNFDPLVLPNGIAPSDDPLLSARSAAYAESFRRRAGESGGRGSVEAGGRA
ncbi:catalase family peroxidase [Nocardia carnea]|nr:catalase family peroxidase [Nocardia carnea]